MKSMQIALAGLAALVLAGCANAPDVSRGIDPGAPLLGGAAASLSAPSYRVSAVNVTVPQFLSVSEANSYKPQADIVWRGDPYGNRYEQIETLVTDAITTGVAGLNGSRAVVLDIQVTRFHALTERTRYTFGGTHDIHFILTVLDAETGAVLEPARQIETELNALGGSAALAAEARGETQKVRISAHLRQLIIDELQAPRDVPAA